MSVISATASCHITISRTTTLRHPTTGPSLYRRSYYVMAMISCATIFFQMTLLQTHAYSFVTSRNRSQLLQRNNNYLLQISSSSRRRQSSASSTSSITIEMKKPPTNRPSSSSSQLQIPSAGEDLPANLKRYVVAKRPTLGHIVPKKSRTRHYKPLSPTEQSPLQQAQRGGSNSSILRPQGQTRDNERYNNPSSLRILGGSIRGRKLESPNVYLRPMMGKVKEAVYSTFTSFGLYDTTVRHLDIFSGSGSVGLESLSRGASHCTFVDMSSDCCATCERNVQRCGFDGWVKEGGGFGTGHSDDDEREPQARVVCSDAYRALRHPETVGIPSNSKYDIVTLCPPYEEIVYAELLEAVANSQLVTEDTIVLVEYPVELGCLPHAIGREDGGVLVGVRNRRYGRTVIAMYIVNPTGAREAAQSKPEEFISIN